MLVFYIKAYIIYIYVQVSFCIVPLSSLTEVIIHLYSYLMQRICDEERKSGDENGQTRGFYNRH